MNSSCVFAHPLTREYVTASNEPVGTLYAVRPKVFSKQK